MPSQTESTGNDTLAQRGANADSPPSGRTDLTRVAVLERCIAASLERVWENVLDWEHLPWLHRASFAEIECTEFGDWGWRARAASRPNPDARFGVELLTQAEHSRYVTRTLQSERPSSEIWTWLDPTDAQDGTPVTQIRVEFWMPNMTEATRDGVGSVMLGLYQQLWDEDEAMMQWRSARLADPHPNGASTPIDLGPPDALRASLPRCFGDGYARVRVVEIEGRLHSHRVRCPHRLGPLEERVDGAHSDTEVVCPWHGYRFDVRTGMSSDGRGLKLAPPPSLRTDPETGHILLDYTRNASA